MIKNALVNVPHQWFVYAQRGSSATQHVVRLFTNTFKRLCAKVGSQCMSCTKPDIKPWDGLCLKFKFQACCS